MPIDVWMASIRRGGAPRRPGSTRPLAAGANAGVMASSQGSASATPAPRRNVRRASGRFCAKYGPAIGTLRGRSFRQEQLALHDLVYQRPDAVPGAGGAVQDALDGRPVG